MKQLFQVKRYYTKEQYESGDDIPDEVKQAVWADNPEFSNDYWDDGYEYHLDKYFQNWDSYEYEIVKEIVCPDYLKLKI